MSESNDIIWENVIRAAENIVKFFGENCEVVVHDFEDLSSSAIHVAGNVTNRKIGAPLTDLVVGALHKYGDHAKDLPSYRNTTTGGRILKSSTTFMRNDKGKIIGAICINFDITDTLGFNSFMDKLTAIPESPEKLEPESFFSSRNDSINSYLERAIKIAGKTPHTMSREERIELISNLESRGAFLIKGAVEEIAKGMGFSKYTVYTYLKEARGANRDKAFG